MNHTLLPFRETQRFTQWWIWAVLLGLIAIPIWGIYQQEVIGEPMGNNPMSTTGLFIWLTAMVLFAIFFGSMKLETTIDSDSIDVRLSPFVSTSIALDEIKSAQVVDYGFVGGWGIRVSSKYGTVYNMKGRIGLALEMNDGRKLCIGTQKADELKRILKG